MTEARHEYPGAALTVTFDAGRCIHWAACVRSQPGVFDTSRRPWIKPDQADPDAVTKAVESCPTGALRYVRRDGGAGEQPPPLNVLRISRNGPVYLRGDLALVRPGSEPVRETRMALCRCGASARKPYCDGSHARIRFEDSGLAPAWAAGTAGASPSELLVIEPTDAGPLRLRGGVQIRDVNDTLIGVQSAAALCACGRSGIKPFCDGSHADAPPQPG